MNLKATIPAELFITSSSPQKTVLIPLIALVFKKSFSQGSIPGDSLRSDCYLQKSKSQETNCRILLALGITTPEILSKGETHFDALAALAVVSVAATLISVPLFISAVKNSRKAMSLSVKKETRFLLRNADFAQRVFPGTSVKFNLENNHHQNLFL